MEEHFYRIRNRETGKFFVSLRAKTVWAKPGPAVNAFNHKLGGSNWVLKEGDAGTYWARGDSTKFRDQDVWELVKYRLVEVS